MATRNVNTNVNNTNQIVAFFSKREDAYRALSDLKQAGFNSNEIGLAVGHEGDTRNTGDAGSSERDHDTSMWQKVKDFFSGDDSHDQADFDDAGGHMGWTDERWEYYRQGVSSGGAVITVSGNRIDEAQNILQRDGGDLRQTGFEGASARGNKATDSRAAQSMQGEQRIQLRGEMLRTYKERVPRGEVRLHKEVVTENRSVQVPVTREELVIERTPGSGQAGGEIGRDAEVRVPLSEERVRVEKQPVVNEEVRVSKRQVQSNKEVSDQVRHEELRVDKQGEATTDDQRNDPGKRKNRVA